MKPRGFATLRQIAEALIRRRVIIIISVVLLASVTAYFYRKIPRDPSVEAMVLDDDPDLKAYNHFKEIFGNDEFFLLALKVPDIFDRKVMEDVEALRKKIEKLQFIKEAVSFTNVRVVRGTEDAIVVEELVAEIPKTDGEMAALRKRALAETDYVGNLYSEDARTLSILARLDSLSEEDDTTETRTALTKSVRELAGQPPFDAYGCKIAGVPALKSDLVEVQTSEGVRFEIIIFSLLTFILFLIFRTIGGVFVTLGTVMASIFVLMAMHYFSGIPLTMVSTILTPLMLIYGISSSVHIQTHYALISRREKNKHRAIAAAVALTIVPCAFNSITTAVGFGSNIISDIKPIREFAMFASGGIILSLILSFLVVPTGLSFFPRPGKATRKVNESGLRVAILEAIIRLIERRRNLILLTSVVLLGFAVYGISLIRVETKLLEYFRPESPIRSSYRFIEENLSGISSVEIMVDTKEKGGMKNPEVIAAIETLVAKMSGEPNLTSILSLANFYKRINQALHGDDPEWRKIPETRAEAAQFLLLYSMSGPESDLFDFVSPDYRYGRISMRIKTMSSTELQKLIDRIKNMADISFKRLSEKGVNAHVTGSAVLYANMNSSLVWGQIKSFSISLLLISLMMILVAGEIGLGIVSLLPNLMPIMITMGFMGYAGFPLDSTTSMVAPIALGMAVDSTIHFMVRFRREYLTSRSYHSAMTETVRLIGRAMIGTSTPLAVGFWVLISSEFVPIYVFGLLSGIVVVLAMVFDLVLTPICLMLYKPKYRKKGLVDFFD